MKKNAFTLIELLAVIVILAIIALIAVPVVVNIISDSKKESINRSIDLYIDHVQKMIANKQMKDSTFNPSECEIKPEGILECKNETKTYSPIKIEMKGQMPKSGTIKFSKGMVVEGVNLELDNLYYQVTDDNISEGTKKKVTSYGEYIKSEKDTGEQGLSVGDKYTYKVNDTDTFTFYVLSIEGDKVNLIMNSNICNDGTPADKDHECNYAWHAGANDNNYGPDTAMTNLYQATKSWSNVPNINLTYNNIADQINSVYTGTTTYGYIGITINDGIATIEGKSEVGNTIIGTIDKPLKARLPKYSEVTSEEVGCSTNNESCEPWVIENLRYYNGENGKYSINKNNGIINTYGYWLLSSQPVSNTTAHDICFYGSLYNVNTSSVSEDGIRPVITVPREYLES